MINVIEGEKRDFIDSIDVVRGKVTIGPHDFTPIFVLNDDDLRRAVVTHGPAVAVVMHSDALVLSPAEARLFASLLIERAAEVESA